MGAPYTWIAISTMSIARSTPAQKPRGAAKNSVGVGSLIGGSTPRNSGGGRLYPRANRAANSGSGLLVLPVHLRAGALGLSRDRRHAVGQEQRAQGVGRLGPHHRDQGVDPSLFRGIPVEQRLSGAQVLKGVPPAAVPGER